MKQTERTVRESQIRITRRGLMLGGIQAAVIGTLAMRMRKMQLEEADNYRMLAEGNSVKIRLIPPARGLIYDRNGVLLAGNEQNYRITITREDTEDLEKVISDLRRLIPMTPAQAEEMLEELRKRPPTVPVTVADRVTWEEFSRVAVNAPALPGVTPEVGLSRIYPRGDDCAHILGYVGPVSDYDLSKIENPDPLLMIPKFQLGKLGVEAKLEDDLRGKAGQRRVEVNSAGREMRELGRREGTPGENVQLTIDYQLQNFCLKRLGDESAAVVVMDVTNGDVLACSSAPSFDANLFVRGISVKDYRELTQDDHRPLADKSVQGLYPPGSTYKMVTALAALEEGLVTPEETIYCRGFSEIAGRRFHCWKRAGHGYLNLSQSLEQSCDCYYYELSQRVGIDKTSAMAQRLGLGIRPDLPMSAVQEGLAPTKDWKRSRYGQEWLIGDTINASIGQGYVLASPMHLAIMTARLASGKALQPNLIRSENGVETPRPEAAPLGVRPENLTYVRRGMNAVVNGRHATAGRSKIAKAEWKMAGKTGTSQVRNITAAERARGVISNSQLPWNRRDHALFVCYAPVDNPKYAVSVVVEHGSGGSTAAAPIGRDVMLFALAGGKPPMDAYPSSQRGRIQTMYEELDLVDPATVQNAGTSRA
ncbi:penicillin-binding protein 2 [Thioclava sp. SK-1]|uniref:penicillin-binding protein 2 n=1 Tax=Thioclava sp. SK-1 TaxID=1889770 RepID=UPI00082517D3|nr:penicillin-binding protein 2 [Thioclava sp. SK-1]OCX66731.1 penicillin-binding protein 2 [Thioclava sp. SK-1]